MNPQNIPFNALIVGPTNSGKTKYVVNLLSNKFNQKFDYIFLIYPTFIHNKTYDKFGDLDKDLFILTPLQNQIDFCLKLISFVYEGTNTLIILDDCAASKDVKQRTNELVNLAFSARHKGISVWVLTQQMTSIAKPFRENIAALVLFYTPSAKDMKATFDDYAGDLTKEEQIELIAKLKNEKYSHLILSLCHPFDIKFEKEIK